MITKLRTYVARWRYSLVAISIVAGAIVGILFMTVLRADVKSLTYQPQTRTYYVAAEDVEWNYAPGGLDTMTGKPVPAPWGSQLRYQKVRYIEYTDATFKTKKPQPEWLNILGPIIRGVPGDTIKITFKNTAQKPYSMHPHGVQYTKDNEGSTAEMRVDSGEAGEGAVAAAAMPDMAGMQAMPGMNMPGTPAATPSGVSAMSAMDGAGAQVMPGKEFTYIWHVRDDAGPAPGQGSSRVWLYHSHVAAHDIFDGLVGTIVITSAAHARADATPDDVDHEFVSLFEIFDESTYEMDAAQTEASLKHTINGRFFDTLKGYTMKQGDKVRWYEVALGNEADVHTPHWHGNVVDEDGKPTDVVELMPASMKTVDMVPDNPGTWAYHCHIVDHMEAGMMAMYKVEPK